MTKTTTANRPNRPNGTDRPNRSNGPNQLILLDAQPDWRLDERTRRVGREGLARARAALRASRGSRSSGPPDGDRQPEAA